jgi:hypothetical protein
MVRSSPFVVVVKRQRIVAKLERQAQRSAIDTFHRHDPLRWRLTLPACDPVFGVRIDAIDGISHRRGLLSVTLLVPNFDERGLHRRIYRHEPRDFGGEQGDFRHARKVDTVAYRAKLG